MKLLSASFFVALGLAIGTTISALTSGGAGGQHVQHVDVPSDTTATDYASVIERNQAS